MQIALRQKNRGQVLSIAINDGCWASIQRLAVVGGWERRPSGLNKGDKVGKVEARQLSLALKSVLDDIPKHDALAHKTVEVIVNGEAMRRPKDGMSCNLLEAFSGQGRELIETIVAFCGRGCFKIK